MIEWRVKAREFGERWRRAGGVGVLKPAREDWLDQSDGVLVVLLYALWYVVGGGGHAAFWLTVFALGSMYFRMLDRRIMRERARMLDEALKMLDQWRQRENARQMVSKMPDAARRAALRLEN